MTLEFSEEIRNGFPDLQVLTARVVDVEVDKRSKRLERFKGEVLAEVGESHDLERLKDVSIFRTYRDFFWDIGIDPTKTRPAAEALVRRVLQGKDLPRINTLVDAYNLASIKSGIPLAAFDYQSIEGGLTMRFAREGEEFLGIGMDKPLELGGEEIVVSDSEKLVAVYPYRDSEETKITTDTEDVLLMVCGAPGVGKELGDAKETVLSYVKMFCDGVAESDR